MKILITGGTGTISSGLVAECISRGYDTFTINRGNNKSRNVPGAECLYANVFDAGSVNDALGDRRFDVIVECLVGNVDQLKISLNNFASRCYQYVFISSTSVFSGDEAEICENSEKTGTKWQYARKKIECEAYLTDYFKKRNNCFTIIRPPVTYGNYRVPFPVSTRTPVYTFFRRIEAGKPLVSCDNVEFSVSHSIDFSKIVVSLFGNTSAENEDFNICADVEPIRWDDVAQIASKLVKCQVDVIHIPHESYKIVWPEIHDELCYNKSKKKVLSNQKVKRAIGAVSGIVDIESGMELLYEASKSEYYSQQLSDDSNWNFKCDLVLYHAFRKHLLKENEYKAAAVYFEKYGPDIKLLKHEMFIRELKSMIKRVIGRL